MQECVSFNPGQVQPSINVMFKHDSFLYGTHLEQNIFVQVSFRQTAYELLAGIISSRMDASSIVG
jgi:hypothetical protein